MPGGNYYEKLEDFNAVHDTQKDNNPEEMFTRTASGTIVKTGKALSTTDRIAIPNVRSVTFGILTTLCSFCFRDTVHFISVKIPVCHFPEWVLAVF